jgi:hypothetical protein
MMPQKESNEDPFHEARPNNYKSIPKKVHDSSPDKLEQNPIEESNEDPFYEARAPNPKDLYEGDDIDQMVERNIAGFMSRGVEQIAGFPGNMRDFAKTMKNLYHEDPIIKKMKILEKEPKSFQKFQDENLSIIPTIGSLIDWFPTSSELREKSNKLTKGYTEPTDEYSKMGHEIFEDVISSIMPGSGPRNIFRNVAIPVLSFLAKQGANYFGIEEKGQTATKFGTTLLLNMMNRTNAPRLNREMWNNVERTVPNVNIRPNENAILLRQARDMENQLLLGLGSNSENSALRTVREFIEKLDRPNGTISARELAASNRSLNEIVGDPALLQGGRNVLNQLRNSIHTGIEYVAGRNPTWVQQWRNANETHGAIANSNFISNYVSKNYSKPLVSEGTRALFGSNFKVAAVAATAPIFAIYKGTQVLSRMARSPILQRYYTNAMLASLRGNTAMMTSNLEKLDKELAKKEKKYPYK